MNTNNSFHVYLCDVPSTDNEVFSGLLCKLNDEERQRYAKFLFDKDKQLFLTAHWLKRHALSRYTGIDSLQFWRFSANKYGKPFIDNPSFKNLHFNLSHCHSLVAVIIGPDPCGIDVEAIKPLENYLSLATSYFHPDECKDIKRFGVEKFYQYWTLKEAYIKYIGTGLSQPLNSFKVDLSANPISVSMNSEYANNKEKLWSEKLGDQYYLAYCIQAAESEIFISKDWVKIPSSDIKR